MINVLVVSALPAVRAGLERLLEGLPGLSVAARAGEGLRRPPVRDLQVVVICQEPLWRSVVDELVAPGAGAATPGVVFLSDDGPEQRGMVGAMGAASAWAVLPQAVSSEELGLAVRAVSGGLHVVHPSLLDVLAAGGAAGEAATDSLTDRERGVLDLLSRGYSNPEIAAMLGISENTVKFHTSSLYQKLGVANRTEAVRAGIRAGAIHL